MKATVFVMTGCLLLGAAAVSTADPGQGRGKHRSSGYDRYDDGGVHGQVNIVFSTGDVRIIREHYRPQYRNLPKGLRKKLARTGQLPPGWQKKVQPFPYALERRMVALPDGYHRGVIDGNAVIYHPRRGVIIDATVVF